MEALNGLIFSQGIMLKLTQKGVSREAAYKIVQKNAMKTWKNKSSFYQNISKDKFISKNISSKELKLLFYYNLLAEDLQEDPETLYKPFLVLLLS